MPGLCPNRVNISNGPDCAILLLSGLGLLRFVGRRYLLGRRVGITGRVSKSLLLISDRRLNGLLFSLSMLQFPGNDRAPVFLPIIVQSYLSRTGRAISLR